MNFDYNKNLESSNFIDGVEFTKNDPCIWNVYPPGASGDLLASIINFHYGRTGSDYFGINDHGQVMFRPSDYKITNTRCILNRPLFDDQYFFDIAESLAERNINYSLCDQFIFSCHMYHEQDINSILKTFPKCKIICTYLTDSYGHAIANTMANLKNRGVYTDLKIDSTQLFDNKQILHPDVLNIPFGALFSEISYYEWYDKIIKFLNLNGRLVCFDYIKYYITKQHPKIKNVLPEYGKLL